MQLKEACESTSVFGEASLPARRPVKQRRMSGQRSVNSFAKDAKDAKDEASAEDVGDEVWGQFIVIDHDD